MIPKIWQCRTLMARLAIQQHIYIYICIYVGKYKLACHASAVRKGGKGILQLRGADVHAEHSQPQLQWDSDWDSWCEYKLHNTVE